MINFLYLIIFIKIALVLASSIDSETENKNACPILWDDWWDGPIGLKLPLLQCGHILKRGRWAHAFFNFLRKRTLKPLIKWETTTKRMSNLLNSDVIINVIANAFIRIGGKKKRLQTSCLTFSTSLDLSKERNFTPRQGPHFKLGATQKTKSLHLHRESNKTKWPSNPDIWSYHFECLEFSMAYMLKVLDLYIEF